MSGSSRPANENPCEWCDKLTTKMCSGCHEVHLCSKVCLKAIWKEHKRTCEKTKAATAADELVDQLEGLQLGK